MPMIPVNEPLIGYNELEYVTDCLRTGWISSTGKYSERFEKEWAAYSAAGNMGWRSATARWPWSWLYPPRSVGKGRGYPAVLHHRNNVGFQISINDCIF